MYRWVIAWRWLKTLPMLWISVVGVCLGVASILVVDSIFNGVLHELERVFRGTDADLFIPTVPPPSEKSTIVPTEQLVERIRGCEGVAGATARLSWQALLPPEMKLPEMIGIGTISRRSLLELRGIDPAGERGVTDLLHYLEAPPPERRVADPARPFDLTSLPDAPHDAIPIVLGDRAADALGLKRGSTFDLLTFPDVADFDETHPTGVEPLTGRFVLVGTFKTEYYVEDLTRGLVPARDLARWIRTSMTSTQIAVRIAPGADLETVRERLVERIGGPPFNFFAWFNEPVLTWDEMNSSVRAAILNQRQVLDLILFFVVIVAGFNLLVSLNLILTEKLRDIGTLAALGASAFGIASVFSALGFLVTLVGSALGLLGGAFLAHHINEVHHWIQSVTGLTLWEAKTYLFDKIPTQIAPGVIGLGVAATFAVTLLFAFLASLRAARLDPVVALRHE